MKAIGMARKIDRLGRIVLPAEMRKALELGDGDLVEIVIEDDHIALIKVARTCVFCGRTIGLRDFRSKVICGHCVAELNVIELT
jgi:transcriptional pleiotropic regulator of transition state genes